MPAKLITSDSDGAYGRMRAATFPSPRRDEAERSDQDDWGAPDDLKWHDMPPTFGYDKKSPSLIRKSRSTHVLKSVHKNEHGGVDLSAKSSPRSRDDSSATATSPSPGGNRRRGRKGSRDEAPLTRQQRLVSVMFGLVLVLASAQILTLVVHVPRDHQKSQRQGQSNSAETILRGSGKLENRRIIPSGYRNLNLRGNKEQGGVMKGEEITVAVVTGKGPRGIGGSERRSRAGNQEGLSLTSPRAFEMVAADMGNLKDTVEKLDRAFREAMGQQRKDLTAVMEHLALTEPRDPGIVPSSVGDISGLIAHGASTKQNAAFVDGAEDFSIGDVDGINPSGLTDNEAPGGLDPSAEAGEARDSERSEANVLGSESDADYSGDKDQDRGLDMVWNAYAHGNWVNGQWIPKVLFDESLPDMSSLQEGQRRVLILSERRSGGQAVGTVLNADSRVFYVGDPCRMGGGPEALEGMGCATMVSRLLACQPTINDVRNLFSFSYIVERSRALSEIEQLRWHGGGTPDGNDELVRSWLSRDCFLSKLVVVKETRMGEAAPQALHPALATEFLHVVRDPRAAIHGIAETWGDSGNKHNLALARDCTELATRFCALAEKKLADLTELGRERFRVLKYEILLEDPVSTAKGLYSWLELDHIPDEVNAAILSIISQGGFQSAGTLNSYAAFERATRWTMEMPTARQQQIQDSCKNLLAILGYDDSSWVADQSGMATALHVGENYWRPPPVPAPVPVPTPPEEVTSSSNGKNEPDTAVVTGARLEEEAEREGAENRSRTEEETDDKEVVETAAAADAAEAVVDKTAKDYNESVEPETIPEAEIKSV